MRVTNMKSTFSKMQLLLVPLVTLAFLLTPAAYAATPGISGSTFNLTAQAAFISQPDGSLVYSWGYGCNGAQSDFLPGAIGGATCPSMQIPGPTLIITAPTSGSTTVTVNLTNNLPTSAGNTSILFPGFQVAASGGVPGLLAREAAPAGSVSYTLTIPSTAAGTHAYYSGTEGDLQVEMGLYGAIVVIPSAI